MGRAEQIQTMLLGDRAKSQPQNPMVFSSLGLDSDLSRDVRVEVSWLWYDVDVQKVSDLGASWTLYFQINDANP